MSVETKYISRYTGAQIDEALGLLFAGESTRDAAYQAAEAERDTQFESKEATRDEANRAALDAAEVIAELQRQARGRVTDIDSLHNVADIGTYHYIGNGWKGLVNVNFDASSKVSQVALSSSTPSYENDSLTWLSGKPCVMVRTYTNGAWSAWSKAGADVVNDLVTGGTDKALSAEQGKVLGQKVADLGLEIGEMEERIGTLALGKFYGYRKNAAALPALGDEDGYAYVGTAAPYSVYNATSSDGFLTWKDSGATFSNLAVADEEDIDYDANGKLQFANRVAESNQKGYKILRKGVSPASQMTDANTIYEVRYNHDLGGGTLTLPQGSVLKFDGGTLANGTIIGHDSCVDESCKFGADVSLSGTWTNKTILSKWFVNDEHIITNILAMASADIAQTIIIDNEETIYAYPSTTFGFPVPSNTTLIVKGTIKKAANSGSNNAIFDLSGHDIRVVGGIFDGNKSAYSDPSDGSEIGFAFTISGSAYNISIENAVLKDCRGDGIYIVTNSPASNIVIKNCEIKDCLRNGISVIQCCGLTIDTVYIHDVAGGSRSVGAIDFEPNTTEQDVKNCIICNSIIKDSVRGVSFGAERGGTMDGLSVFNTYFEFNSFSALLTFNSCSNISIKDCRFKFDNFASSYAVLLSGSTNVSIDGCSFEGSFGSNGAGKHLFSVGAGTGIKNCNINLLNGRVFNGSINMINCSVQAPVLALNISTNTSISESTINLTSSTVEDGEDTIVYKAQGILFASDKSNINISFNRIIINDATDRCLNVANTTNLRIIGNIFELSSTGASADLMFVNGIDNAIVSNNIFEVKTNRKVFRLFAKNSVFRNNAVKIGVDFSSIVFDVISTTSKLSLNGNELYTAEGISFTGTTYNGLNTLSSSINNDGDFIYDGTSHRPLWFDGSHWKDSDGELYNITRRTRLSSLPTPTNNGFCCLVVDASNSIIVDRTSTMTATLDVKTGLNLYAGTPYVFTYHRETSSTTTASVNLFNSAGQGRIIIGSTTNKDLSQVYIPTQDLLNYKVAIYSGVNVTHDYSIKIVRGVTRPSFYQSEGWLDSDGEAIGISRNGTFADKPVPKNTGFQYFCTTGASIDGGTTEKTNIVIYYTGSGWVDANGNAVVAKA